MFWIEWKMNVYAKVIERWMKPRNNCFLKFNQKCKSNFRQTTNEASQWIILMFIISSTFFYCFIEWCKLIINLSLSDFHKICVFFSVYYQFVWFVYFLRSHEHLNVNKILNCFILRRRFLDRTKHNKYINIESIDLPQNN